LRSRLEVNINRIGVIGHGEGANVALLAAGQPLPPAFVVALAAYGLRGQETLLLQQVAREEALNLPPEAREASYKRQRAMYDIIRQTSPPQAQAIVSNMLRQEQPALDPQVTQDSVAQLLTPWRRYFLSFDPVAELDRVQCPVLLLSGTADEQAPTASHQQALEKELKSINRKVTAKRLPDVNHLFQPPITEWALVNGERKPVFSPAAQEIIRAWIEGLGKK